jgi:hypothetical protein
METLRRTYGIAEPVKRGMELHITRMGEWRPMALGGGTPVHSDILSGRDWELGWEDVFHGKLLFPSGGIGGFGANACDSWRGVPCYARFPHGDGRQIENELVVCLLETGKM